jgi:hypothetical protein
MEKRGHHRDTIRRGTKQGKGDSVKRRCRPLSFRRTQMMRHIGLRCIHWCPRTTAAISRQTGLKSSTRFEDAVGRHQYAQELERRSSSVPKLELPPLAFACVVAGDSRQTWEEARQHEAVDRHRDFGSAKASAASPKDGWCASMSRTRAEPYGRSRGTSRTGAVSKSASIRRRGRRCSTDSSARDEPRRWESRVGA